jgi:hypothetical protein
LAIHFLYLYCTLEQHCTALHCIALHCTALHCTALHCTCAPLLSATTTTTTTSSSTVLQESLSHACNHAIIASEERINRASFFIFLNLSNSPGFAGYVRVPGKSSVTPIISFSSVQLQKHLTFIYLCTSCMSTTSTAYILAKLAGKHLAGWWLLLLACEQASSVPRW